MAENPSSILVIGPRWVGDMVMAQCLFSALKERWPGAAIDVMGPTWAKALLARMPEVRAHLDEPFSRGRLEFGARRRLGRQLKGRYDRAYVMQGNWKSALVPFFAGIPRRVGHLREMRYGLLNQIVPLPDERKRKTALNFRDLAGPGALINPRLSVDNENQAALLKKHDLAEGGYAALMPGAEFGPAKRWPAEKYAALTKSLVERDMKVVLLGSGGDRETTAEIAARAPGVTDLAGETRLEDAIDLIAGAGVAVSNDSGLMHIAAAVGTPVVAVYGSTSPENTPPLTEKRELVWLALECSPCHQRICPLGHMNCLNTLEIDRVLAAVDRQTAPAAAR